MTLEALPSPARIRQIATQRQIARFGRVIDPALVEGRERAAARPFPHRAAVTETDRGLTALISAERRGNVLFLAIDGPPRTKKNHGQSFGIKQSPAYKRYRQEIVTAVAAVATSLQLPLPAIPYNCAATFYVDRYGEQADYNGLNQGLHDALEDAGVLLDDWWIRTCDGTRIVVNDPAPRVALILRPLDTGPVLPVAP